MLEVIVVYRRHFLDGKDYDRYIENLKLTGHKQAFAIIADDDDSYTVLEYSG